MNKNYDIDPSVLSFLFTLQSKRRVPPLYMIFTRIGLFYMIGGFVLFGIYDNGIIALFFYFLLGKYIYNNEVKYRFYQAQNLYFVDKWISFINPKNPKPHDTITTKEPK